MPTHKRERQRLRHLRRTRAASQCLRIRRASTIPSWTERNHSVHPRYVRTGTRLFLGSERGSRFLHDTPAHRTDARFQTETAYGCFKRHVVSSEPLQLSHHLDQVRAPVDILAVDRPEHELVPGYGLYNEGANVGLFRRTANGAEPIDGLHLALLSRRQPVELANGRKATWATTTSKAPTAASMM